MDIIALSIVENESRIDSRIVAKGLGIQHESFMKTLYQRQTELEELGILRFEIGEIDGRGQPEKYVMLNEDHVIFVTQLSRNTSQVVQFKLAVTKAFSAARQQLLPAYEQQIEALQTENLQLRAQVQLRIGSGDYMVALDAEAEAFTNMTNRYVEYAIQMVERVKRLSEKDKSALYELKR